MTTRDDLKELVSLGKKLGASDLALLCDISRQRVYQILGEENLQPVADGRKIKKYFPSPGYSRSPVCGPPVNIKTFRAGIASELLAMADLVSRGYFVYFPFNRFSPADILAITPSGKLVIIEVRIGRMAENGEIIFRKNGRSNALTKMGLTPTHYAVVLQNQPIHYVPPLKGTVV